MGRLTRQQLGEMGIKAGHQVKLLKRANEEISGYGKKDSQNNEKNEISVGGKVESGYGEGDINEYADINEKETPEGGVERQTEEKEEENIGIQ